MRVCLAALLVLLFPAFVQPQMQDSLSGTITPRELEEARNPLPPVELSGDPGVKDFDLRAESKSLWKQVAQAYHIDIVFETDYQAVHAGQPLQFQVNGMDCRGALQALEIVTDSFAVPVGPRQIFIARDTPQKRMEYEHQTAVVVPIPETVTPQEVQEVANAVRSTMEIRRLVVDAQRRLILVRDSASKVLPARRMIEDLMRPRAQVAIELNLLSTDHSTSLNYGVQLPTSFPLVSFGTHAANIVRSIPQGFTNFFGFGGGRSFIGIGVTDASLFAAATENDTKSLYAAQMVAVDGQAATLKVGQKYPITTASYIGQTSGTSGQVYTPPPTIEFEDLGLNVKITPYVHGDQSVSLDIEASFELLTGQTSNAIPVIGERKFQSRIDVKPGQWAVIAGMLTESDALNIQGIAGLASIPVAGNLFRTNDRERDRSEALIVLKPHIVYPPVEAAASEIWVGTETRPRTLL